MAEFKCTNEECSNFGIKIFVPKMTYMWNSDLHKFLPKDPPVCPVCKGETEEIPEETNGKIECNFTKFNSLTSDQKKSMMKKRYQDHSKKEAKEKIHEVRKQILGDNYKLLPKGI